MLLNPLKFTVLLVASGLKRCGNLSENNIITHFPLEPDNNIHLLINHHSNGVCNVAGVICCTVLLYIHSGT